MSEGSLVAEPDAGREGLELPKSISPSCCKTSDLQPGTSKTRLKIEVRVDTRTMAGKSTLSVVTLFTGV